MKLQNLTVIFIIIIIPIILLVSMYISTGLKTINYQALYDTGLLTATHDAIYAFELNTANDEYSANPETKREILKSSIKMFEKSLCNTCGISTYNTAEIEKYIPAIVFGMYDGFYMYAPSYLESTGEYEHNLKSYVYYSEILNGIGNGGTDVVIRYSLDNYITVAGDFGDVDGDGNGDGYQIKSGHLMVLDGSNSDGTLYKGINIASENIDGTTNTEGIEYYKDAFEFTNWFNNYIELHMPVDTHKDIRRYFLINSSNDPEDETSLFVQHKKDVIKNKIESVLNSSITAYSEKSFNQNYKMPKFSEEDWQKIYSNISMITFFQGKSIGLTKYNGYCVLNSTNSKEYVNPNLMYFTVGAVDGIRLSNDGTTVSNGPEYHDIRCRYLQQAINEKDKEANGYKIGSFSRKKVSEADDSGNITTYYEYEHEEQACYYCVNGQLEHSKTLQEYLKDTSLTDEIKTAYWTSLARERYNTVNRKTSSDSTGTTNNAIDKIIIKVNWTNVEDSDKKDFNNVRIFKNRAVFFNNINLSEANNWEQTIDIAIDPDEVGERIIYNLEPTDFKLNGYVVSINSSSSEGNNIFEIRYEKVSKQTVNLKVIFENEGSDTSINRGETVSINFIKQTGETISENIEVSDTSKDEFKKEIELPREDGTGSPISYIIRASNIEGYGKASNINTIENLNNEVTITIKYTYLVETTVNLELKFDDEDNIRGFRPNAVDLTVKGEDGFSNTFEWSNSSSNTYSCKIRGKGEIIPQEIDRYTYSIEGEIRKGETNNIVVTYKLNEILTTTGIITLHFDDYHNLYGTRPTSLTFSIKSGDNELEKNWSSGESNIFEFSIEGNQDVQIIGDIENYELIVTGDNVKDGNCISKGTSGNITITYKYIGDAYLYNNGEEYSQVTGGWYPTILGSWNSEYTGALLEKGTDYLYLGDNSTTGLGDGSFTTWNGIENIEDYKYLCINYKVKSKQSADDASSVNNRNRFRLYFSKNAVFIDDNSDTAGKYRYKEWESGKEFNEISYVEKTREEIKNIVTEKGGSGAYSSVLFDFKYYTRLWGSTEEEFNTDEMIEQKINISGLVDELLEGSHLTLSGYAHARSSNTIEVKVYQVYLTNE